MLVAAVLFPLIPWLMVGSVQERFSGTATLKSIANLAAFFAIAAWAVNLVLATRVRPVERAVGGLEHLYRLHRRIGILVVVLAVTHVLFLSLHAWGSALDLYLPSEGWSRFSGVVALVLLVGFVVASLVGRLAYPTFVLVQRLLGVTFVLGAFHTFAVRGTAASSPALTIYVACLTTAAVLGAGYRFFGGPLGIGRRRYRVAEVRRLDEDAVEITLNPVKRLGDFTGSVMQLRAGAEARLEGPFGSFCLREDRAHSQTWIAGGIGITPFLSWARGLDGPVAADLYYCTPGPEHAHFLDELFDIADRYPAFRIIPIRKRSLGHLTVADIEAVNPNIRDGHVFICGPSLMIDNLTDGLLARGVLAHRIHSESFDFR